MRMKPIGLVAMMIAASYQSAFADIVVPNAVSSIILTDDSVQPGQVQVGVPSPITQTFTNGGATSTASTFLGPPPTISATVSISGGGHQAIADVYQEYFFTVTGPTATLVPITIVASGNVSPAANVAINNSAQLYFGSPSGVYLIGSACQSMFAGNCSPLSFSPTFTTTTAATVTSNEIDNIQMSLHLVAQTDNGALSGSGFVDPSISIDPTFLAKNPGFSLQFSPGIVNAIAAVPEPSTWAMMLLGFAGIGTMGWRRRRAGLRTI